MSHYASYIQFHTSFATRHTILYSFATRHTVLLGFIYASYCFIQFCYASYSIILFYLRVIRFYTVLFTRHTVIQYHISYENAQFHTVSCFIQYHFITRHTVSCSIIHLHNVSCILLPFSLKYCRQKRFSQFSQFFGPP